MTRHDGHSVSQATVLRLLRDEGLILGANYQRERRRLAERRKAAFAKEATGPLIDDCQIDDATGEILPVLTIVTDNGGPFRSFTFEAFIATRPELRHVRTRVRPPGQNGSLQLVDQIGAYRHDYNHVRPHEAIAWNRPADVYAGTADPTVPNFETKEILPTT